MTVMTHDSITCFAIPILSQIGLWPWPLQLGRLQLQGHLRIGDCGGSSRDLPGSQRDTMMSPCKKHMVFTPPVKAGRLQCGLWRRQPESQSIMKHDRT